MSLSIIFHALGCYQTLLKNQDIITKIDNNYFKKWPKIIHYNYPLAFENIFSEQAKSIKENFNLLHAIARKESVFNPLAISKVGALGMMQLMPTTAQKYYYSNVSLDHLILLEPKTNIKIAAAYLKNLQQHYHGDIANSIAAYNAGEVVVDEWIKNKDKLDPLIWIEFIAFKETRNYVKSVMKNYEIYNTIGTQKSKLLNSQLIVFKNLLKKNIKY